MWWLVLVIIYNTRSPWTLKVTALQEFLIWYKRTPFASGYFLSELLNGRHIRATIDIFYPSPMHQEQKKQDEKKHWISENTWKKKRCYQYSAWQPCYALYCGPRREKQPRWVPAINTKLYGTRWVNVQIHPKRPTRCQHVQQLQPRYSSDKDKEPWEVLSTAKLTSPTVET